MRDIYRDGLAYTLLIAIVSWELFISILIAIYGEFAVYEPNKIILIAEIAVCVGILALGIERLRHFIKTWRR